MIDVTQRSEHSSFCFKGDELNTLYLVNNLSRGDVKFVVSSFAIHNINQYCDAFSIKIKYNGTEPQYFKRDFSIHAFYEEHDEPYTK